MFTDIKKDDEKIVKNSEKRSKVIGIMLQHTDGDKEYYCPDFSLKDISNNNYQTHAESRGQLQLPVGVSRIRVERKRITYGNLWI